MSEDSKKWTILVATIWIQAFTGTNFDFSAYSSEVKTVLGFSQVQLNYLAVASDLGKVFGWSSGVALMYFPVQILMVFAAGLGFVGYGVQWLVLCRIVSLPYFMIFFFCLLAGCSICWFNTVCFILCIRNFQANRALALSLTVSFNGVSAALYTLAANSINPYSGSLYLFLNAIIPLLTTLAALILILRRPKAEPLPPNALQKDSFIFLLLNILAIVTGFYLLFLNSSSTGLTSTRLLFCGAILLLMCPLCIPGIVYAQEWFKTIHSGFILVDDEDLELKDRKTSLLVKGNGVSFHRDEFRGTAVGKDQLVLLGVEHSASLLVRKVEFWLYYIAYFCGGTIGLVYSNNLGQIAHSLGESASITTLITIYSSFSFFGRLLSAAPDYIHTKFYLARTGWLALALTPTPIAFFLLNSSGNALTLHVGTALIGLSSGFIFATAVSVTSELFGPLSVGINHNILITNIPIGSFAYGLLAAKVYDSNAGDLSFNDNLAMVTDSVVCMGKHCYLSTFMWWGCFSVIGLCSSVVLFMRTRAAYDRFESDRLSSHCIYGSNMEAETRNMSC